VVLADATEMILCATGGEVIFTTGFGEGFWKEATERLSKSISGWGKRAGDPL